jgi:surfactin synthase thioesterase subunit
MIQAINHHSQMTLFCFPYAGGNLYSYREMTRTAPKEIKIVPLEYPGRFTRQNETLLLDINDITADCIKQIKRDLREPYALYGHSMGSIVAYLVTQQTLIQGLPSPIHLFVSGTAGPSSLTRTATKHDLPRQDFFDSVRKIGGSSEEIFEDEMLLDFIESYMRADFKAIEEYKYQASPPLNIPISAFIGKDEDISLEEAYKWRDETVDKFQLRLFEGNHFFIFSKGKEMMKIIYSSLLQHRYKVS